MNWMKLLTSIARVVNTALPAVLPVIEEEFGGKSSALVGASLGLASAGLSAASAKGSPASIAAVGEAAMSTAQAAGLSSTDQKNAAGFVSAIGEFMPVVTALGSAGLSDAHATLLKTSADYLTAAASGVSAALSPAAEPAPAA